jgi:hypothetical protein
MNYDCVINEMRIHNPRARAENYIREQWRRKGEILFFLANMRNSLQQDACFIKVMPLSLALFMNCPRASETDAIRANAKEIIYLLLHGGTSL